MTDTAPPAGPAARISLREVTSETLRAICDLSVADDQKGFVAPNVYSIAQAYFEPKAWFRAIYADETPVGFVMLYDDPEKPEYFLWRLMIDAKYQGRGFGRRAIQLLVEYVKTRPNATELRTSYVPGERGPEHFYRKLGFESTGRMHDDEIELKLRLDR